MFSSWRDEVRGEKSDSCSAQLSMLSSSVYKIFYRDRFSRVSSTRKQKNYPLIKPTATLLSANKPKDILGEEFAKIVGKSF